MNATNTDDRLPVILASQSPRRKQLLEWAEIPFDVVIRPTDETWPPGMALRDIPVHIARNKAELVRAEFPGRSIIAADTVVVLNDRIIGKPSDAAEARAILRSLAGTTHQVITGVVILGDRSEEAFAQLTAVTFHPLTNQQIDFYVEQYKPFDKAGAYGIQEWIGVTGISRIEGDFYNVMGLPVSLVVQALDRMKS